MLHAIHVIQILQTVDPLNSLSPQNFDMSSLRKSLNVKWLN